MTDFTFKKCVQTKDQKTIVDLIYSIKDELRLPDIATVEKIVNLCFHYQRISKQRDRLYVRCWNR